MVLNAQLYILYEREPQAERKPPAESSRFLSRCSRHPLHRCLIRLDFSGGKTSFPRGTKASSLRAIRLSPSHPVKLAAVYSVSSPVSPLVPPLPTVELIGAHVNDFSSPPPTVRVSLNGLPVDYFIGKSRGQSQPISRGWVGRACSRHEATRRTSGITYVISTIKYPIWTNRAEQTEVPRNQATHDTDPEEFHTIKNNILASLVIPTVTYFSRPLGN